MRSVTGAVQDMLVTAVKGELVGDTSYTPAETIELSDDRDHTYLLEAYCLNFDRDNPGERDKFEIGSVNAQALALIHAVPQSTRTLGAAQAAIWLDAGVSRRSIQERFPVSVAEMSRAEQAVAVIRKNTSRSLGERTPAFSASESVRKLMAEPVSMFEWGLFRLEERAARFAWDTVTVSNQFSNVRHDPVKNRLTLTMTVYPTIASLAAVSAKESCALLIGQIKSHFGVSKDSDFMRDISGLGTFFRPQFGSERGVSPVLAEDLEAMTDIRVEVMVSETGDPPFEPGQSCSSGLLSPEIVYDVTARK